jgi:spermidine/putrescine transport system substrate-binding protein
MIIKRRKFLLSGLVAISSLSLKSCGWKLGNIRTSSVRQGPADQLQIYTWTQYSDPEIIKTFASKTGIKVITDMYDSNEVMLAKLQAGAGGTYSIVYPSDYMVQKMGESGLLSELDKSRLTGLENFFPRFKSPSYDPENRYSIPFTWGTTGFLYNSEKLSTTPDDWNYLWQNKEKLNKKMTLLNDVREVMGGALKMLGHSYNSKNENEIKQAYDKLKELKPHIAAFDTDSWRNQILAGDLLIAMCYSGDGLKVAKENPKLKYVIPKSGSSLWTDTMVIPKTAINLDGAYAWMNFMLKPETAAQISQRQILAPPNQVAVEQLPENIRNNAGLFPDDDILDKCERIAPIGEIEQKYARYWTELTSG